MGRLLILLAAAAGLCAQTEWRFEVASIHPVAPGTLNSAGTANPGMLRLQNIQISNILTMAYAIRDYQLSGGPTWIWSDGYDITAKRGEPEASDRLVESMRFQSRLRNLLADRLGLKVHEETRELPVYGLTIAKGGHKLNPAKEDEPNGFEGRGSHMEFRNATVDRLIGTLGNLAGRPIIDETGLAGRYNLKFDWSSDDAAGGPSIFTALQEQLGLRLEPKKASVKVIVIDNIKRPSEN